MGKHDVTTVEGQGFEAKVHYDDNTWHAQVRVEDDQGKRGRVLNFVADNAQDLANRLGDLASNLVSAQNAVLNAATDEPGEQPPDKAPETGRPWGW